MRSEPTLLPFDDFAEELIAEEQPRAAVILAASKIDRLLHQTLTAYFSPKATTGKNPDELLDGDSPLSVFSARIKICRRLDIIDPDLAKEFDCLREIRNQAAHWVTFSIRESPLREQFQHLRATVTRRKSYTLTVKKFLNEEPQTDLQKLKSVLLTLCVVAASIAEHPVIRTEKIKRKID